MNDEIQTKVFTFSYHEVPQSIDTSRLFSISEYYLAANLGGTLVVLGAADQYYSCLARRWEVDRAKNTLTFTLDPRARFSNGEPITTEDVVSTFKRLALKGSLHFAVRELLLGADRLQRMEDPFPGVVALDAAQVRFTFHQLSPLSLYLFTMADTSILHRSQVEEEGLAVNNWTVSSGAYSVAAWEPGKLRLRKNIRRKPSLLFHPQALRRPCVLVYLPKQLCLFPAEYLWYLLPWEGPLPNPYMFYIRRKDST